MPGRPTTLVGQGPAVLAAGAGWVGYVFFVFVFFYSILSSFSNASSVGRRLLKYCKKCFLEVLHQIFL